MSDKHRHHSEGVDLDSRGVVNVGNFVEKHARLKGGSRTVSAITSEAPCPPSPRTHARIAALLFSTTIVCCVNKKRGIDHHCRRSQVLGGTRIFLNFVDAYPHGHRVSRSVRQPDFTHRPAPAPTPMDSLPSACCSSPGRILRDTFLSLRTCVHHRRHLTGPIDAPPLTPETCLTH